MMPIRKNHVLFFTLGALLFAVSLVLYLRTPHGSRHTFSFPAIGSERPVVEVRYLSLESAQGDVQLYVDELLLGSQMQRVRPLFSPGTRCEFCFVRGHTLYVGLSSVALHQDAPAADIMTGIEFFKRNILYNFAAITDIELFIGGTAVE